MPLVRYEIRNEYSLANPELYRAANKDDPQSLLEGVAMAGMVGILRQLGDLAEFAAEIFHDLHEEVMVTAARGHRLMLRVQQLETEFPSVEKALMSETNQIHFAYTTGADWHASIWNEQNHLTQGDLPRFILNSYEECRGPPRLFLLDKFDVAGAGACLKRYTDPSFFKMEWASCELMKAEKAQRERKARRLKKKGRRCRNGETPNIVPMSQLNSRIRYSSWDLDGPKYVPGNLVSTFSQKLKSKQVNGSPVIDQEITRKYMQDSPFNLSLPKEDDHGSSIQDKVTRRVNIQGPSSIPLHKEDSLESPSQECKEKPLAGGTHGSEFRDNLASVPVLEYQSLKSKADVEVERTRNNCRHVEQKDVSFNSESKPVVNADEDQTDEVPSEADNYMDALTTMESEMETDSESRAKHEVDSDVNSEQKEMGFEASEELQEQRAQCSNFVDAEASTGFYNCELSNDSLKVESSSRFFNTESGEGSANVESTISTMNGISEDNLANVELPTCLTSASESVEMSNNESISGLDNGITSISILHSLSSESLNNEQIPASEDRPSGTDIPSAIAVDAVSHTIFSKVKATDVLNHGSSAAFANAYTVGRSANATPSAELDNGEASFRLAGPKLSIVSTDVDLQTPPNKALLDVLNDGSSAAVVSVDTAGVSVISPPSAELDNGEVSFRLGTSELPIIRTDMNLQTPQNKEQLAIAESSALCSEDMVADVKLQMHPPEVDKADDPIVSVLYADCNINESVVVSDASELVSGIGNAAMQDEYECTKSHAENAENRASTKPVNSESFHCQSTELPTGLSSSKSVGQLSVESDIQIVYNGSPADSGMLSTSAHADFAEHAIDAELIEDQVCGVLPTDRVTPMKSVVGLQENEDPEESTCTKSILDVMPMGLSLQCNMPSDFQDAQMPENYSCKILTSKTSYIESVVDSLGNKSMASFESSNELVNVLVKDSSNDLLVKEIDLAQPVPADAVHVELASANVCRESLPNESIEAVSDGFLGSEIPTVYLDATFPAASCHTNDTGSHENLVNFEPHTEVPDEVFNAKSPRSSFDEKPAIGSFDTYSGTQLLNTVSLVKSVDATPYAKAESPPNPLSVEAPDSELPSPPLEHIKISFHSAAELPCSTYATSSHHVSESPTPERCRLYESKTDDLSSSFHLLPEPAIPLQQGAKNESIGDLGSLSSRRRRKLSEIIPDKTRFSQIIHTDDDSENGGSKEFEKSSSNSPGDFFNQPLEPPSELTGFSGMTTVKNEDTGSPRVLSGTSVPSSSSPDSTRSSFLPKPNCTSLDAGSGSPHSSNISMGSSSRSPIFSAFHCPMSPEETYHNIQSFSRSQSTDLESELLVPTSPTLEPKFLASDSLNEMPPLPPLPPLEWRIMKPRQKPSLPLMEAIEPTTPPASCPMLMPDSPVRDPSTSHLVHVAQKVPIEQKDSLIEAIASHDKTMLKKVTKQTRPISTKPLDDREVLLEQIRTRSFSLRHTVVVKHGIPRPATNINVAAILEKANAIRQAFAGSDGDDDDDDDDDDDWSDA